MAVCFTHEERLWYLRQYGSHCLAYSTLQPGMRYFDVPGIGYLAYMQYCGTRFVLGDPICSLDLAPVLIREALSEHSDTCFIQTSEQVAIILKDIHHYYATCLGIETWIDLPSWSLKGTRRKLIRKYVNRGRKTGLRVYELSAKDISHVRSHLLQLRSRWLKSRRNPRRVRFLVRPPTVDDYGVRVFLARLGGELVTELICDPIYGSGSVAGYNINLAHYSPKKCHKHAVTCAVAYALDVFRQERLKYASLGLSPLNGIAPLVGDNPALRVALQAIYRWGNSLYNFRGLAENKHSYCGRSTRAFACTRRWLPVKDILCTLRICNLI
ncbi:MAG: DUF2156 domain-containing protein [Planctomycetes bacterium]|nr:DUF2156 domain-containing protein [Planctomycetota bacterium]